MTYRPVEAVLFWRYLGAAFKAVYGRPSGIGYSKNYLQVSTEPKAILDKFLKRGDAQHVPVKWSWPGSSLDTQWHEKRTGSDRRGQLYIRRGQGADQRTVRPFQVGDPAVEEAITFSGRGTATSHEEADAEMTDLEQRDIDPWLIAVKLEGEEGVLHARAYVGNPSSDEEELRAVGLLPEQVRRAMRALPPSKAGGGISFKPSRPHRAASLVERIRTALARDPNVLLVGPPGTGKTVALEDLKTEFEGPPLFDPTRWTNNWEQAGKVVSLVFHPSFSYEDFVVGLSPEIGEGIRLRARPGPLVNLAHWARSGERQALLILDEFNRGAPAAIFGDTLALLEGSKRVTLNDSGASIQRPHSGYPMIVQKTFADAQGSVSVADELTLPWGLKVVGALNSSDRSTAPLDAALRRRFTVIPVGPDYEALARHFGVPLPPHGTKFDADENPITWSTVEVRELALRLLQVLNERIAAILGLDFVIGHALLWSVAGETVEDVACSLSDAFQGRILATLRMSFVDQDEALAAVLGVDVKDDGQPCIGRMVAPAGRMTAFASPRLHLKDLAELGWVDGMRALRRLLD